MRSFDLVGNKFRKIGDGKPEAIWQNSEMDALRKTECMCLNCYLKDENPPYKSCPVAGKIYEICKEHDMAMAITRCGVVGEDGKLMFFTSSYPPAYGDKKSSDISI